MSQSGNGGLPKRHTVYDDPGPENIRSTIGWAVLALTIGDVIGNIFLPNNDLNIAVSAAAKMCLYYYVPRAVYAIWIGSTKPSGYLIVGVVLSWFSQDGQAILSVMACLSRFSPTLMNSELFSRLKLITVVAAICHVVPRGAADCTVPRRDKATVFGFLGSRSCWRLPFWRSGPTQYPSSTGYPAGRATSSRPAPCRPVESLQRDLPARGATRPLHGSRAAGGPCVPHHRGCCR